MAGKDIFNAGVDLIIPVPLHYTRMFKRKYNQSAVLSAGLSKLCGIPVDYKSLKKTRHTLPQVHCSGKQRLKTFEMPLKLPILKISKESALFLLMTCLQQGQL